MTNSTMTTESALEAAKARFAARNPNSLRAFEQAAKALPGGNTRTVLYTTPFPICLNRGIGHKVFDEDGHEYTDLVGEFSAGIFGHSSPQIIASIQNVLQNVGLNLGGHTIQEATYATLLCERFNLERIRFCNSGTEANLHALAAARRYTGKRKVVVFGRGYHGAVLSFREGPAENNVDLADWVMAKYNDVADAKRAITTPGVAAVLVEGMQGNGGALPGTDQFLKAIQETAKSAGVVFILDEVMTSRLAPGGLKSLRGLDPDLTTYGKYLGGGLAFGAFGGKKDIMAVYDPRLAGSLVHSGTFNNNTLAMNAGYTGMKEIFTPEACTRFYEKGESLKNRLNEVTKGSKLVYTGVGSLICVHITPTGTLDVEKRDEIKEDEALGELFWLHLLENGFWITKRGFLTLLLETPDAEYDRLVKCVGDFTKTYRELVAL